MKKEYKEIPESIREQISNQSVCAKIDLGKRLLELREEYQYKQGDVAKAIGISRPALGYYENGERGIDVGALQKIAKLYGVSVDYLLGISAEREVKQDQETVDILKDIGFSNRSICNLLKYKIASKFVFWVVESENFAYLDELFSEYKKQYSKTKFDYNFNLLIDLLRDIFSILNNINEQRRD